MLSKITLNSKGHKGTCLNLIQKEIEKVWLAPLSLNNNYQLVNVKNKVLSTDNDNDNNDAGVWQ